MKLLLGPVLYLGHCGRDIWSFHVSVLVEGGSPGGEPPLAVSSGSPDVVVGAPSVVADFGVAAQALYWRFPVHATRAEAERWIGYRLEAKRGVEIEGLEEPIEVASVAIPARGSLPRMAFFSCNGFSDEAAKRRATDPYLLWRQVYRCHVGEESLFEDPPRPFHFLIGGGDQVYADHLWESILELHEFSRKSEEKKIAARPSEGFFPEVLRGYLRTYVEGWRVPEVAKVFACVPAIFTWDDHDIFDGWGSHGDDLQHSEYYQAIYRAASLCFEAFQLGGADAPHRVGAGENYLQALTFQEPGVELDLLLLDGRSGRKSARVLSPGQSTDLENWLQRHAARRGPRRHLIVVSSTPFVYMSFDGIGRLLGLYPAHMDIHGDLRDQWQHPAHRAERNERILAFLRHGKAAGCVVTFVSGDVHIGGRGRITSKAPEHILPGRSEARIEQVISSGIVHPAPGKIESYLAEVLGSARPETIAEGVRVELLEAMEKERYLWERNWLSLAIEEPGADVPERPGARLWARLAAEDGSRPQYEIEA